ncbi:MAG: hypothetical protein L3J74_17900 [Bacteroidales bacterium]|nr:hypothetical protein [Bacteroidales bacterium]
MRTFILLLSIYLMSFSAQAQIALAVEKNDNGSSIKYAIRSGKDLNDALQNAYQALKDTGATGMIVKMKQEADCGHELNMGYYVLIRCDRKSGGRFLLTYGLGAGKTRAEAIKRALIHLKEFDWGFEDRFGYDIIKEGKVEDLFTE